MTYARYATSQLSCYNNNIFVFGGYYGSLVSSVEAFDISAQSWTSKASPPSGAQQYGQAAVVFRDLIWQCGGYHRLRYAGLLHVQPTDGRLDPGCQHDNEKILLRPGRPGRLHLRHRWRIDDQSGEISGKIQRKHQRLGEVAWTADKLRLRGCDITDWIAIRIRFPKF